jgi:serine/threonine protein phosphatase PrpC
MKIYSYSLQGKRQSNEDTHLHILNLNNENSNMNAINLLGVFDGHGGKLVSKYLKDNLPSFFINKFDKDIYSRADLTSKYFMKVYDTIQNNLVLNHPRAAQYCGSTACVCVHYLDSNKKNRLWVLNVGDSRAVKCNYADIAEQLSSDHKPCNPYERTRIEQLGGKIEFDGSDWRVKDLSLSRAFGDLECKPYVSHLPQIYKYKINSKDKFIILACDGLWDVLSNQDAVDFVNNLLLNKKFHGNFSKELAEHGLSKGSLDNITVLIYMLE